MQLPQTFSQLGIDLKGKLSGTIKTKCPECSHTRKKQNDPCLSVSFTSQSEGVYNCHNCGFHGSLGKAKTQEKAYVAPPINNTPLSDKTLAWFQSRGISKATVLQFKISETITENRGNWINFNYFRNSGLINVKYRSENKEFRMAKGAELIFYNLDSLTGRKAAYITEGEMDCLTVYELFPNLGVVSVPNGASNGTNNKLEYLDNCWQHFEDKEYIILLTDTDGPGLKLREELARRLGKERCYYVEYPKPCKDINEVLLAYGVDKVKEVIENVHPYPMEGILTIHDIDEEINEMYLNGPPKGANVGYFNFDTLLTFRGGELTTITGSPQSGKSEFIDQITERLAVNHGWKFGVCSVENQPVKLHFAKIAERYIGKKFYHSNRIYAMTGAELEEAKTFVNEHYFFINLHDVELTISSLLEKARQLVKQKGINGFIIDPWNCVEHNRPKHQTETDYTSEQLSIITNFAKVNNVHVFLVAHPTKLQKDKQTKQFEIPTLYSISGSAHFFNKTDNGFVVYRQPGSEEVDIHVQKVRFKWIGKPGMATFKYDWTNGRYSEI